MQTSSSENFTLAQCEINKEYTIKEINTNNDKEMEAFLFSLGCYEGQIITIVSMLHKNFFVSIKDSRYSIDEDLAKAIIVEM